jgi:hypothetical protein
MLLSSRNIAVFDVERARILACTDLEALDRWLIRAATAASVAALFQSA